MRIIARNENSCDDRLCIPWVPGAAWFRPMTSQEIKSMNGKTKSYDYVRAVEKNLLEQSSSVSSTADRMLTSASYLGFTQMKDLYRARLATLWMADTLDHNVHEILFASKSFYLPFSFKADFYKEIYPPELDPDFVSKLKRAQQKRGFELPDYYLSL
jgi:hypothetical protein